MSDSNIFFAWRNTDFAHRAALFCRLGDLLEARAVIFAAIMSDEMGKPTAQGIGEVKKCAKVCRHYAAEGANYLRAETVQKGKLNAEIRYEPIGTVLSILPWNFPFWQVFRVVVPSIMAGNLHLVKHAPNVPRCAAAIADLFLEAGFEEGVYRNLVIQIPEIEAVIARGEVRLVTLTGSERAGRSVAGVAAKYLKKCVLELGGSDPFVVCADADLDAAAAALVSSRFGNNGQACNAAKRLIVHESIQKIFLEKVIAALQLRISKREDESQNKRGSEAYPNNYFDNYFTHLARPDLAETLQKQVKTGIAQGAQIFFEAGAWDVSNSIVPVLLVQLNKNNLTQNPLWCEEVFGPVLVFIGFATNDEALHLANDTVYGLGATVFTANNTTADFFARSIEAGFVAVNQAVSSDPLVPFGGVKNSGFGRELGSLGMRELCNVKTVTIGDKT